MFFNKKEREKKRESCQLNVKTFEQVCNVKYTFLLDN